MITTLSNTGSVDVRTALVVDDDKFMLAVICDLLGELGVTKIITATDGSAAIEAYDAAVLKPEVVLCDLNMPVSDGFQLMEQLASRSFGGGVILISGMDDRFRKSASLMARFHRFKFLDTLRKPVERAALQAALAKLD